MDDPNLFSGNEAGPDSAGASGGSFGAAPVIVDLAEAKRDFSRLGIGAFAFLGGGSLLQILFAAVFAATVPELYEQSWMMWLVTFAPLYLLALPLGLVIMKKTPAHPAPARRFGFGGTLALIPICIFIMYAGNLVGTIVTSLFASLRGSGVNNPVETLVSSDGPFLIKVLILVVAGPLIEELVFRKVMIDRMRVYGEKLAVVTTALMFGLFHGNLSQFFYAFGLGLVFGYVYVRTGRLRYSAALHMLVNFIGSILAPTLLERADLDALTGFDPTELLYPGKLEAFLTPGRIAFGIYIFALLVLALLGLILLCILHDRVRFDEAERELPKNRRFTTVWCNFGMLLFLLASLALIAVSLFALPA